MKMRYSLWDMETGNVICDFASQDAALRFVRRHVRTVEDAASLLLQADDRESSTAIASGRDLFASSRGKSRPAFRTHAAGAA
jgi:hypothetical protein